MSTKSSFGQRPEETTEGSPNRSLGTIDRDPKLVDAVLAKRAASDG